MKERPMTADMIDTLAMQISQSNLFRDLDPPNLLAIAKMGVIVDYVEGDIVFEQGVASDSFAIVLAGEVVVKIHHEDRYELIEVARVGPFDTVGELGMLLDQPRSATVIAAGDVSVVLFKEPFFSEIFQRQPKFGFTMSRILGKRLQRASRSILLPLVDRQSVRPNPGIMHFLPFDFIQRHRVLPLNLEGNTLYIGFVEDPTPRVMALIKDQLPGMDIRPLIVDTETFDLAMTPTGGVFMAPGGAIGMGAKPRLNLDQLLKRMVAEGASDLHLSGGQKPRWRIDGVVHEMTDREPLGETEVQELLEPLMTGRHRTEFGELQDTDFAYSLKGVCRFRVNVFRDHLGVGAVLRQIPAKILSIDQLGLPPVIKTFCDLPQGLVLVTGPTGNGKSTTLAAMIDYLNDTRAGHIITLEDPIEFVHQSRKCLINQREVGSHTSSFSQALRAGLREDPDVVLVGEMRDLDTVSLALETANTGHLVFATLHTNTASSSIARIMDMFPSDQQNHIQSVLADTLKGVVCQTLCRRSGGGRVAALEILVSDVGVASMIREGKAHQMLSAMQTGKARGNRILNEELARLVQERVITQQEALSHAVDKIDLSKKLGIA